MNKYTREDLRQHAWTVISTDGNRATLWGAGGSEESFISFARYLASSHSRPETLLVMDPQTGNAYRFAAVAARVGIICKFCNGKKVTA